MRTRQHDLPTANPLRDALRRQGGLSESAADLASPADVLRADGRIGVFLRGAPPEKRRWKFACAALICVAAAAIAWFGGWFIFNAPSLPRVREAERVAPFAVANAPERFREQLARINSLIAEGRGDSTREAMLALLRTVREEGGAPESSGLRKRLLEELLVLADSGAVEYLQARAWYGELEKDKTAAPSFRAMQAYAFILQRHDPGNMKEMYDHFVRIRSEYGAELDRSRELLAMEIRACIGVMPSWLRSEPVFSDSWRKSGHALRALKQLSGETGRDYLEGELARWGGLRSCFSFFEGENARIEIAGVHYTRWQIDAEIDKYRTLARLQ